MIVDDGDGADPSEASSDARLDSVLRRVAGARPLGRLQRPLLSGDVVGHFKILSELGRGGMGIVYLAQDEALHRSVALKVLRLEDAHDDVHRKRLLREARTAASVKHPNIATVYEVSEHGDRVFIAIEYIDGVTVRARMEEGPLALPEVQRIARSVLDGLAAVHAAGLVHRDLKPDNIMIDRGGLVRILDFGLARHAADGPVVEEDALSSLLSVQGEVMGTPAYMSPEQALGDEVDARSDIYSFGTMLYELLAGHRPFAAKTRSELMRALLGKAPAPLTEVRPEVSAVVLRCLEKEPEARFPDVGSLQTALDAALGGKTARKRGWGWMGAGLSVALAAGAWVWSGSLPTEINLAVETTSNLVGADAWLARASTRLLERRLRDDRRIHAVKSGETPNVVARFDVQRTADGQAALELSMRRAVGGRPAFEASVQGPSVTAALDQLIPSLFSRVDADRPEPPWSEEELSEAKAFGVNTPRALPLYRRFAECMIRSLDFELAPCVLLAEELTRLEPEWPRAWMALGLLVKMTPEALDAALDRTKASPDALGRRVLEAVGGIPRSCTFAELDGLDPMMFYAGPFMGVEGDGAALLAQAWRRFPELQFGFLLFQFWKDEGRRAASTREWEERAPEGLQRIIMAQTREALEGGIFLYGTIAPLLLAEVRLAITRADFQQARVVASTLEASVDEAIVGSAQLLAAETAVYEGRFGDAMSALERARRVATSGGVDALGNLFRILEGSRQLAEGLGDEVRASALRREFLQTFRRNGFAATIALLEYEARPERCPDPKPMQATLIGRQDEQIGLALLSRAAWKRGCGSCKDVLSHGLQVPEFLDAGLYSFAACAEETGEYELALRTNGMMSVPGQQTPNMGISPWHVVLGKFQRARVLEKMGRRDEAKAAWEDSLRYWQHADRPVPARKEAEEALRRLAGN